MKEAFVIIFAKLAGIILPLCFLFLVGFTINLTSNAWWILMVLLMPETSINVNINGNGDTKQ